MTIEGSRSGNIDTFISSMIQHLPKDIIEYIVRQHIFLPKNLKMIQDQKTKKSRMMKELKMVSNIIYIDSNCCVYINHNNNIVIHNNNLNNMYLYGNTNHIIGVTPISNNTSFLGIEEDMLNEMIANHSDYINHDIDYTNINNHEQHNANLLSQINNTLDGIQSSLDAYFQQQNINTSNIVNPSNTSQNIIVHTTHTDADEIVFVIVDNSYL
jgi:hypothetical protein